MEAAVPRVGHCFHQFLPLNHAFLYTDLLAFRSESMFVLAEVRANERDFPYGRVHCFASDGALASRWPGEARAGALASWAAGVSRDAALQLLHAHGGMNGVRFIPCAMESRLPLVITFMGYDVSAMAHEARLSQYFRTLLRVSAAFVALSEYMRQQVIALGCDPARVTIVRRGVPLDRLPFRVRTPGPDAPVILYAGRFVHKKGLGTLVRAFRQVVDRRPRARLRLVGDGPLKPEVVGLVRTLGLESKVEFPGWQSHHQLVQTMLESQIFCIASETGPDGDQEGIPNVLKEAMGTGMPSVSTRHAGIPELVEDGVSGLLAPEGNAAALADCLLRLSNDPSRWAPMGQEARRVVESEYSATTQASRLIDLYRQLAGQQRVATIG